MTRSHRCTARVLLLLWVLAFSPLLLGAAAQQADTAFHDVHVLPMDTDRVLMHQNVLVDGDRIVAVGPADTLAIPEDCQRIEGNGALYLIPGMAELHGHIPPPSDSQAYIDNVLFLYVANGVTTVRGMLGHEGQLELRQRANRGAILSPSLYLAGPAFSGQAINSPAQAVEQARRQKEEGWDYLKVLWGLTRGEYDAMARTAREIGIPFIGHVPSDVGIVHALESGQQTIDHLDGYIAYLDGTAGPADQEKIDEIVRITQESGAWVVPTMVVWENLFGDTPTEVVQTYDGLAYLPPDLVQGWIASHRRRLSSTGFDPVAARNRIQNRMRLLRAMDEGGVRILFGTDSPQQFSVPGFSIYREMQRMSEAGMSAYEILRSATASAGEYFQDKDKLGLVAPGYRADLVLLKANPLEDIAHVAEQAGVMVRGRWLPQEELQARLAQIVASYQKEADRAASPGE